MARIWNGEVTVDDGHVSQYTWPSRDSRNDVTVDSYSLSGRKLDVRFKRRINTGDRDDKALDKCIDFQVGRFAEIIVTAPKFTFVQTCFLKLLK